MLCVQYHSEKEQVDAETTPSCFFKHLERDVRDNETEKMTRLWWLFCEPIWKNVAS